MTRKIACILLLTLAQPVLAAKLYRWHEADGSITFSPTPPAKGIPFDVIGENSDATAGLDRATTKKPRPANPVADLSPEPVLSANAMRAPKQSADGNKLSYAPASNGMKPGISRSEATVVTATANSVETGTAAPLAQDRNTVASVKKRKQCDDLSKRVVSLERRLKLELSDEDMDNTVIHMARYQASYDQHCTG